MSAPVAGAGSIHKTQPAGWIRYYVSTLKNENRTIQVKNRRQSIR